jgi:hypothetical protein
MNGSVDIAKGAYIFDVNCNEVTSSPIAFLIRAGVELKMINRIMSNKIVVDYCNAKVKKQSALRPEYRTAEQIAMGRDLTKAEKDAYKSGSFFETLTIEKLDDMLINSNKDKAQMLQMFIELSELSTDLAIVSNNFKHDVDGLGGNLLENIVTEDAVNHILNKTENKTLFGVERLLNGALGTYRKNASEFAQEVFGSECVTANSSAAAIYKRISNDLGNRTLNNTLVKKISKSLYAYSLSGSSLLANNREFVRSYTKASTLNALLNDLKNHETNGVKDLAGNLMLNKFTVTTDVDFVSKKEVSMITFSTPKLDKYEKNEYISSFAELLQHQDPDVRDKAEMLIKLAFMTSGFGKGLSSYYDKIPFSSLLKASLDVESAARGVNMDNFLDQFYRNNWHDDKIVPNFTKKYAITKTATPGLFDVVSTEGKAMKPYMKSTSENGQVVLYKRVEGTDYKDSEGSIAQYVKESRLGYSGRRVNVYQYNSTNISMDGGIYNDAAYDITGVPKYKKVKVGDNNGTAVTVDKVDEDEGLFTLSGYDKVALKAKFMSSSTVSIVIYGMENNVLIHKVEGVTPDNGFADIITAAITQINDMDLEQLQDLLNNKCNIR